MNNRNLLKKANKNKQKSIKMFDVFEKGGEEIDKKANRGVIVKTVRIAA